MRMILTPISYLRETREQVLGGLVQKYFKKRNTDFTILQGARCMYAWGRYAQVLQHHSEEVTTPRAFLGMVQYVFAF